MRVEDLMTSDVYSCRADGDLASVAGIMWEHDCGAVPVVDGDNRVIGVITDRDICMALALNDRTASRTTVVDVISKSIHVCGIYEDVEQILETMKREQIRRLPVVDYNGCLKGMVSINDIVLHVKGAPGKKREGISRKAALSVLKAVFRHRNSVSEQEPQSGQPNETPG